MTEVELSKHRDADVKVFGVHAESNWQHRDTKVLSQNRSYGRERSDRWMRVSEAWKSLQVNGQHDPNPYALFD